MTNREGPDRARLKIMSNSSSLDSTVSRGRYMKLPITAEETNMLDSWLDKWVKRQHGEARTGKQEKWRPQSSASTCGS